MEMVPHDFDATKKYPVLFHVYGGPGSQLVSQRFELDWQTFVASQLGFVVVTVSIKQDLAVDFIFLIGIA